jgi:solute carrier family 25, member 39/40
VAHNGPEDRQHQDVPQQALLLLTAGVGATLARDVPFSALYWQLLEPIRAAMLPSQQAGSQQAVNASVHTASGQPASRRQIVVANLVAGSTAGAVAAAVTTPLDVVKTRAQLAAGGASESGGGAASSIRASLRAIHADSGIRGLFAGVGPRAARAAPACAIVVASYEVRWAQNCRCLRCCTRPDQLGCLRSLP